MYIYGASATLVDVTASGNTGLLGGAICANSSANVIVSGGIISGNTASGTNNGGGGIMATINATVDVIGATVAGNTAEKGGGIWAHTSTTINLSNTIISGNTAPIGSGADIWVANGAVIHIAGSNTLGVVEGSSGYVTISSGASINLISGIAPGTSGGITVLEGGCTINGVSVPGGTYTSITSDSGSDIFVS